MINVHQILQRFGYLAVDNMQILFIYWIKDVNRKISFPGIGKAKLGMNMPLSGIHNSIVNWLYFFYITINHSDSRCTSQFLLITTPSVVFHHYSGLKHSFNNLRLNSSKMDWWQLHVLCRNEKELLKLIRVDVSLLSHFSAKGFLTQEEKELILSKVFIVKSHKHI